MSDGLVHLGTSNQTPALCGHRFGPNASESRNMLGGWRQVTCNVCINKNKSLPPGKQWNG